MTDINHGGANDYMIHSIKNNELLLGRLNCKMGTANGA